MWQQRTLLEKFDQLYTGGYLDHLLVCVFVTQKEPVAAASANVRSLP